MCTVTYLPLSNNSFILTSNRDETPLRKTIPPKTYLENGVEITYPKDELAGGTWIGTSKKNRLVCLLNGGFENHKRQLPYKMSRGIIVKNILAVDDAVAYINNFDFTNIEPFTLILVDWNTSLETYELVWDGKIKYFNHLPQQPKIWSSSTLYNASMKKQREVWFKQWLKENAEYSQNNILRFHNNATLGNKQTSIKMKREFVETVSITSILKKNDDLVFNYFDVLEEENNLVKV